MTTDRDWEQDRSVFVTGVATDYGTVSDGPLFRQFAELTRVLLSAGSVGGVLEEVVRAAKGVVPGADVVSVTLREPDGSFHTPVETDPVAQELDQAQYSTGEGPCVDCARLSGPGLAYCKDLATDQIWPQFGPIAAKLGMGALLSTALLPAAQPPTLSGALNIYSREVDGLGGADHTAVLLLATHASLALAHTTAVEFAALHAAQLRTAIDSRDVIGQAKGILMSRRGVTADEAFQQLRTMSQHLNVKLADLARTLAERHGEIDLPATD